MSGSLLSVQPIAFELMTAAFRHGIQVERPRIVLVIGSAELMSSETISELYSQATLHSRRRPSAMSEIGADCVPLRWEVFQSQSNLWLACRARAY